MYHGHNYEEMTPEKRPQDDNMDGSDWAFETLGHGGEYPDCMPQAIRATDSEGRSCIYVPVSEGGKVVDSKGFFFDSRPGTRVGIIGAGCERIVDRLAEGEVPSPASDGYDFDAWWQKEQYMIANGAVSGIEGASVNDLRRAFAAGRSSKL